MFPLELFDQDSTSNFIQLSACYIIKKSCKNGDRNIMLIREFWGKQFIVLFEWLCRVLSVKSPLWILWKYQNLKPKHPVHQILLHNYTLPSAHYCNLLNVFKAFSCIIKHPLEIAALKSDWIDILFTRDNLATQKLIFTFVMSR